MARSKSHYDPKRNARLAWIAMNAFGKAKTDADIIIELMGAFPGTSESTARADLKALYQRYYDINQDNIDFAQAAALKQAYELYEKCVNLCQMSAAVKLLEHVHKLLGLGNIDKFSHTQTDANQTTPAPDIVRERIAKLMRDKQVNENADSAKINLTELAGKAGLDK